MFRPLFSAALQLRTLTCAGMTALAVSHPFGFASCVGPAPLEARVRSHPDAETYTALGVWFGNNQHSACAAQAFQSGLKFEPNSPRLTYLLGLSFYTVGAMKEAVTPLQRSVAVDPKNERAHLLLGSALAALGRSKEAFVEWQAALRLDPSSPMALDGIARILLAAGDNESVIAQLAGTRLDENLTLDLANAYEHAGQFDNAAATLSKGRETYPNSAPLTSSLASVYIKQLRIAEADKIAEQLARRNPQDIEAQRVYLQVLVFNAEDQAAMPLARKLLAQAPHDADFLYLNGVLERSAGDFITARKHLEEAVKLDPNRYSARFHLGCTLEQLHDNAGSRQQLQRAIELDPNEPESRFELAKVLRKLGEADEAQRQLALYQKQLKDQSDRGIAAQKSTEAAAASRSGDKQRAAALYREAIAALPNNAGLLFRLAVALRDLDDAKGERTALEEAVKVDPTFALAQYELGNLDAREGDMGGAEQHIRLAIDTSPGYEQAWVALATTLVLESRLSDALQAVDSALKIAPNDSEVLALRTKLVAKLADR